MIDPEIIHRLQTADIPAGLKASLDRVIVAASVLLPKLGRPQQRRYPILLEHLIMETIDPATEPQWWETTLYLWNQAAQMQGRDGMVFCAAVKTLHPELQARLGGEDEVSLRQITMETMLGVCLLSDTLTVPKANFVAPNVYSLAQANFHDYAWFRAIYAGKAPVGFMMIVDGEPDEDKGGKPVYFLWRFMIAEPFHGRNYGRQAIQRLVEYIVTRPGADELLVSCGLGEGSPQGFYETLGFKPTGEILDDEIVLRLTLK